MFASASGKGILKAGVSQRRGVAPLVAMAAGLALAWGIVGLPLVWLLMLVAVSVAAFINLQMAVAAARDGVLLPYLFVFSLALTGLRRDVGFWVLEPSQVMFLLCLVSWVFLIALGRHVPAKLDWLGMIALLVVIAAVLSGLAAMDLTAWLKRTLKIALWFGAYLYLVDSVRKPSQAASLLQAGLLASLLASFLMLVPASTFVEQNPTFAQMESSFVGTFANRNEAATYFAIYVVSAAALYALRVHRELLGRHAGATVWLCVIGIILTRSRTGLATLAVTVLFLFESRRMWRPLACVVIVLLLTWNLPVTRFFVADRLLPMLGGSSGDEEYDKFVSTGWDDRFYFAQIYWETIKAYPVLGIGAGNYGGMMFLNLNFPEPTGAIQRFSSKDYLGDSAHNGYLNWWAETGTVGLIPFVGSLCYAVGALMRILRRRAKIGLYWRALALGALGAALVFMITNLLADFGVYEPRYWFVLAFTSIVLRGADSSRPNIFTYGAHGGC